MKGQATTSVAVAQAIAEAVAQAGGSSDTLLAEAGLGPRQLAEPTARVPVQTLFHLWDRAVELTGDPDLGLHAAEATRLGTFDVLDYAVHASLTLGSALRRVARYYRLVTGSGRFELEMAGPGVHVRLRPQAGLDALPRQSAEFTMACLVVYGRRLTPSTWDPVEVRFHHARPPSVVEHERIFRAPLHFEQSHAELVLPRPLLSQALVQANPGLAAVLDRHADELLASLPDAQGVEERVRYYLTEAVRGVVPTIDQAARHLGLGVRTLQRRLSDEQTTYQQVVHDVRKDLAHRYLEETAVSIGEVAFLLGFSESSAFHRAFRRWTGTTPARYRRQVASLK